MATGLFSKMLSRHRTGSKGRGLRTLAATGNQATRLRLVKESELDQKTLEILARRGPEAVRVSVARHSCLELETARRLKRIDDPVFQAALNVRFGALTISPDPPTNQAFEVFSQEAAVGEAHAIGPLQVGVFPDKVVPSEKPLTLSGEVRSREVPALQQHTDQEPNLPESDSPPSESNTSSLYESDDLTISDLELAYQLIASTTKEEEDKKELENFIPEDPFPEDVAERLLEQVFESIPTGRMADELIARLGTRSGAPKLHYLIALRENGWGVDEILLVWRVRDVWNRSQGIGSSAWGLSYGTVEKLVGTYLGVPDEVEVLSDLAALKQRWRMCSTGYSEDCNRYIQDWIANYEAAYCGGAFPPIKMVLGA